MILNKYYKKTIQILIYSIFLFIVIIFATGCTHKISITPNNENIISNEFENTKNYNVAYYIENINKNFISSGGGGDKVSYFAYKDTEGTFRTILSKTFNKVYKVDRNFDIDFIVRNNIKYIFTYKLNPQSFSSGIFTWPPTDFNIKLYCVAFDKDSKKTWETNVNGKGKALFSEFNKDFALSGKRAVIDTFNKLLKELKNIDEDVINE